MIEVGNSIYLQWVNIVKLFICGVKMFTFPLPHEPDYFACEKQRHKPA